MTVLIKHSKVSTIPDTDDTSLVRPSDWNADHVVVGAAESGANSDITSLSGITGGISSPDYIQFDTTYATPLTQGQLGWDGNNTLAVGMAGGNVVQHIGEDQYFYIKASSAITKGQLIMFTGAVGASGVLTGAPSTGVTVPEYIMGVAAESIANNGFGLVQCFGELTNVNTNGFNEGDILYYDSAVTGGLTNVYPSSGIIVTVAAVAKKSAGGGVLSIRLTETPRITASTGISVSQTNAGATITNTAPDQTVAIASGTGISVTGTYPNFTVSNTGVTSVTGTSPVVSSGGTTPAISMPAANGSTNGYLTSTDWTTFNNKGSGTVTSVSALTLGTTGTDLSSTVANSTTTPVITLNVPTASATNRGALSSTDWTTFNNKQNALTNPVTGTGTSSYHAKFTGTSTIGNSMLTDDGTTLQSIGATRSNLYLKAASNSYYSQLAFTNGTNGSFGGISYNNSSQYMQFETNSSEWMRLTSDGKLGMGTTSPDRKLTIGGTTSAYMNFNPTSYRNYVIGSDDLGFILYDNFNSAYRMVVNSSGNVGIGTTSPGGDSADKVLAVEGTSSGQINLKYNGTSGAYLYSNASNTVLSSVQNLPLLFNTNNTERIP